MKIESDKQDEVFLTSSTKLATMLLYCGHTLRRPPCTRQVRKDGRTIVTFLFNPVSENGIETCSKLASRWVKLEQRDTGSDTEQDLRARIAFAAELSNSDDVVGHCYAHSIWRDVALNIVKATPRVVEVSGSGAKTAFLREDITPAELKEINKYL